MEERRSQPLGERAYLTATLSALAVMLHLFKIPYPLMQALKFDLVGVPLLVIGYYSLWHLLLSLQVTWIGITLISQDIVGATMKTLAEASTIFPIVLLLKTAISEKLKPVLGVAFGVSSRVALMCLANYYVLPRWALMVGWVASLEEGIALAKLTMPYIASFNVILGIIVSVIGILSVKMLKHLGMLR